MKKFLLAALISILPGFALAQDYCREYTSDVAVGGRLQKSYGTACLQPDGTWAIQSASVVPQQTAPIVIEKPVYVATPVYYPVPHFRPRYRDYYSSPRIVIQTGFGFGDRHHHRHRNHWHHRDRFWD